MKKFISFIIISLVPLFSYSADLWLPASIAVSSSGILQHTLPIPSPSEYGGSGFSGDFADFKQRTDSFGLIVGGQYTNKERTFALCHDSQKLELYKTSLKNKSFLVPSDPKGGYLFTKEVNGSLELGVGFAIGPVGWGLLNIGASVSGQFSKGYSYERKYNTMEEIKKADKVFIPVTQQDVVKYWPYGGNINTVRTAGVSVGIFTGSGPLSIGGAAAISGSWSVSVDIDKPVPNKKTIVRVSYKKAKDSAYKLFFSSLLVTTTLQKIFSEGDTISFEFDLSNKRIQDLKIPKNSKDPKDKEKVFNDVDVMKAYQHALNGNFIFAEILSKYKNSYLLNGVRKIEEKSMRVSRGERATVVSIPIIFSKNFILGKSLSVVNSKSLGDNTILRNIIGVTDNVHESSGLLSDDLHRSSTFIGTIQEIHKTRYGASDKVLRRYSGNYKYLFKMNNSSVKDILKEFKNIRYRLGLMKSLKSLIVDENENEKDKVGSVQIEIDVLLSNRAADLLMENTKNYSLKDWKNEASSYVEGFFENVVEPEEEVKCTIKFNCKQRIIDKSKKKIEKAYNSLLKMIETKANKDFENYSIAFSEFGKAFVSNRFVFKTILRMLKYKCLSSTYLGLVKANTNPRDLVKVCPKNINKYPYEILLKFMSTKYGPREMILESTQKAKLN